MFMTTLAISKNSQCSNVIRDFLFFLVSRFPKTQICSRDKAETALFKKPQATTSSADIFPKPPDGATPEPSWAVFEKQVLKFDAYFREDVPMSPEKYVVRSCSIVFHLEDDTISVREHTFKNSGMLSGVLVRRHRIMKNDDEIYTIRDLNVGKTLNIYGRDYRLIDCDPFTHDFLSKLGIEVGIPEEMPEDPFRQRVAETSKKSPKLVSERKPDTLGKFLANDRKVLRFFCFWKEKATSSEARKFTLHYFLADETIEILETIPPNSGRDPFPTFMKRQPPPRAFPLGELRIGGTINVHNREFFIYDMDRFTRDYYREQYGVTDFQPVTTEERAKVLPKQTIPDWNGFGTEEDSLGACHTLAPKPPKRDWLKLRENEGKVLRYIAKFETPEIGGEDRRFVISYFLVDNMISVMEVEPKGGGGYGGRMFERTRVKHPQRKNSSRGMSFTRQVDSWLAAEAEWYKASDFYFGAVIEEANPREWPQCDLSLIQDRLEHALTASGMDLESSFREADNGKEAVGPEEFARIIRAIPNANVTVQEVATLVRRFAVNDQDGATMVPYVTFCRFLGATGP